MLDFATESHPLRMSRLPSLVLCAWRAVAEVTDVTDKDESGPAADTGTAAHLGIATFHTNGKKLADALDAMRSASAAFPLADLHEAERIVTRYTADPRNRDAEVIAVEKKVTLRLQPKFVEGPEIVATGTLDQIRLNPHNGELEIWDIKTGNRDGLYFQNGYALQLAGYTMAARQSFGRYHVAGGYIRTKGYFTRGAPLPSPHGVFIPADIDDPDALLDAVRWSVCAIRNGFVIATPGIHCENCQFVSQNFCVPKLKARSA